jgi:acetyl-CoA synthetase
MFEHLGVAQVDSLEAFVEALKVLHVLGPLDGGRVGAMSTSGGDLILLADALGPKLTLPALSEKVTQSLRATVHDRVEAANPLDYQMFTWDDEERMTRMFTAFLSEDFDVSLCVLDYPREDLCDQSTWGGAERGFVRATQVTGTKGAVLTTISDTISEPVAARLMKNGVAMLGGIDNGLAGIRAAVDIGAAWKRPPSPPLITSSGQSQNGPTKVLDEVESKDLLARYGVPIPAARIVHSAEEAVVAAGILGFPVVLKAMGIAHKTDVGAIRLNLGDADEVSAAVQQMSGLCESYLIEKMVEGHVAELLVGVALDEQFGPYLLVGSGGILVEMRKDSVTILMPPTRERILLALDQLECAPLLNGFRGSPRADLNAVADVILAVAGMVQDAPSSIVELDINPLMVLAEGQGVVAADALICLNANSDSEPVT